MWAGGDLFEIIARSTASTSPNLRQRSHDDQARVWTLVNSSVAGLVGFRLSWPAAGRYARQAHRQKGRRVDLGSTGM